MKRPTSGPSTATAFMEIAPTNCCRSPIVSAFAAGKKLRTNGTRFRPRFRTAPRRGGGGRAGGPARDRRKRRPLHLSRNQHVPDRREDPCGPRSRAGRSAAHRSADAGDRRRRGRAYPVCRIRIGIIPTRCRSSRSGPVRLCSRPRRSRASGSRCEISASTPEPIPAFRVRQACSATAS